jgi:pyruvate dehydrogenase E1 component alpha subunit
VRDRVLRRRRDLRGLVPRGRELRGRDARAARLFCNNNGWAISTPVEAQTRAETLADKAVGYGMPPRGWTGSTSSRCTRRTREAVARARAGEGRRSSRRVSYRAAPHATADDPKAYIDLERVEEEKKRECVGRYEGYLRARGSSRTRWPSRSAARPSRRCATGSRPPRPKAPADPSLLFEHALVDPPASFETDLAELRRVLGG